MNLAIFDFDGTLLAADTVPAMSKEWIRQKKSKSTIIFLYVSIIPTFIKYKLGLISREAFKNIAFDKFNLIWRGMTQAEVNEFLHKAYPSLKASFDSLVLKEIETAQQQNFHCVLLSGSYTELLRIVGNDLGFDTVIGAELAFRDGLFYPQGVPFIDGKKKVTLLLEVFDDKNIDWEGSRCFADSIADIGVMQLVGEPVAVNPDPGLLSFALNNQWKIIRSTGPGFK